MEKLKVSCRRCKNETNHDELFKFSEEYEEFDFVEVQEYLVVQCRGCDTIAFIKRYSNSQMVFKDYQGNDIMDIWDTTVYPNEMELEMKFEYEKKAFEHSPTELKDLYEQTINNYKLGYSNFVAAGIRMIVERVCMLLNIEKGHLINLDTGEILLKKDGSRIVSESLEGKINGLYETGYIVFKDLPIFHAIRKLGNAGVHEAGVIKSSSLRRAILATEHLFQNVYETKEFEKLHERN